MLRNKIPVSVIVITKNEEACLARCLDALNAFDEVFVVDSNSKDKTCEIAQNFGVRVVDFTWNGGYPKKRQWCLDQLSLQHDWVFFVDADEVVTKDIANEIAALFELGEPLAAGYFVRANYVWQGELLRHGLCNNKLVLFDRRRIEFPVVEDLDLVGMGEIEGHYQPVLKYGFTVDGVSQLHTKMVHYACDDYEVWHARHLRYAQWEAGMIQRDSYPCEHGIRRVLKSVFRKIPMRFIAAFLHSYIFKFGFLDGAAGFDFARSRARYYLMVSDVLNTNTR